MKRTKFLITSIIVGLSMSLPVEAWVAAGARGVAAGGYGAGAYHGAYGGAAVYSHGAGVATTSAGGTAAWNHGSTAVQAPGLAEAENLGFQTEARRQAPSSSLDFSPLANVAVDHIF